jgi:hypothetical protein
VVQAHISKNEYKTAENHLAYVVCILFIVLLYFLSVLSLMDNNKLFRMAGVFYNDKKNLQNIDYNED